MPSGLSHIDDAADLFIFYDPGIPRVTVNSATLQLGDFGATNVSAFWCASTVINSTSPLYYIDRSHNNFFKTTIANYFSKTPNASNLAVMPIRLIRTY